MGSAMGFFRKKLLYQIGFKKSIPKTLAYLQIGDKLILRFISAYHTHLHGEVPQ